MKETRLGVGAEKAMDRKRRDDRGPNWDKRGFKERRRGFEPRTFMGRLERKIVRSSAEGSGAEDSWMTFKGSSSSSVSEAVISFGSSDAGPVI